MNKESKCYACGSNATSSADYERDRVFYDVPYVVDFK